MDRKRILVVEDDAAIRRGLVDALSFAGYATLEASEGAAGLAAALESDCDLLLLDLVLPGRDGLAVLREIRAVRSAAAGDRSDRAGVGRRPRAGAGAGRGRLRRQAVLDQGAARPDRGRPEARTRRDRRPSGGSLSTAAWPTSSGTRSVSTTASGASSRSASGSCFTISPAMPAGPSRATSCWRGSGA